MRLFLSLSLVVAWPAFACQCGTKPTMAEAMALSSAIFSGKVLDLHKQPKAHEEYKVKVDFEVIDAWKGVKGKRASVYTTEGAEACAFPFKKGARYMVYASGEGVYRVDSCSNTVELEVAKSEAKGDKKRILTSPKSVSGQSNLFWEFHKKDFNAIVQLILDEPKLEPYLKQRKPLHLVENKFTKTATKLTKFGEPVVVMEAFKMPKDSPVLDIPEATFEKDSARVHFVYEAEKLKGDVSLRKEPAGWQIQTFDLVQQ